MRRLSSLPSLSLLALASGLLALSGCGNLDVTLRGHLDAGPLALKRAGDKDAWASLEADPSGALVFAPAKPCALPTESRPFLRLDSARERERFGVVMVDAGDLPPAWRPAHAALGGVLVTAVRKASPLARGGLAPLDLVKTIDGAPVNTPAALAERLEKAADERSLVTLEVVSPGGESRTVRARPDDCKLDDETTIYLPFICERQKSAVGGSFAVGPLDALFYTRDRIRHVGTKIDDLYLHKLNLADHYALEGSYGFEGSFVRRTEWGILANLITWQSETTKLSEDDDSPVVVTESRLRLFWVIPITFGPSREAAAN